MRCGGAYLGSRKSLLAKVYGGAVQVAPHLVVLYDAVAVKDEPHFVEGDVVVLEDDADPLVQIQPNLAIGECALCTATCHTSVHRQCVLRPTLIREP